MSFLSNSITLQFTLTNYTYTKLKTIDLDMETNFKNLNLFNQML